ncbi:hypothetical protein DMA11_22350 [Marinilabiliaceae bacterium JC017]|nr:hypothetical protein DMA11_22350 [Marinilabiliaceae bacterium JC017]
MTAKQITYLILVIFTLTNCKNDSLTEEKILGDILPQLVDSLHISRTNIFPPPPPPFYDEDSNFIGTDSIAVKLILEENEKILKKIDSIDSRLLVGIVDSCLVIDWDDLKERSYSSNAQIISILEANENVTSKSRSLNIYKIICPSDIQIITKSDLEKEFKDVWRIKTRKFGGLVAISQIYFDKNNMYGLLQFEVYPFCHEGFGCFVIIELIDKNWKVKRILRNWET